MDLKTKLEELDPEQVIRLSTKGGSHFVYIGKVSDLDFNKLDDMALEWHEERIERARIRDGNLEKVIKEAEGRKPFADREVVNVDHGIFEDHVLIRVKGVEGWEEYNPNVKPLDEIPQTAVNNLVGAIYREASIELIESIRKLRSRNKLKRSIARDKIIEIESWLREDPLGQLGDPETVINRCYQLVRGRSK